MPATFVRASRAWAGTLVRAVRTPVDTTCRVAATNVSRAPSTCGFLFSVFVIVTGPIERGTPILVASGALVPPAGR